MNVNNILKCDFKICRPPSESGEKSEEKQEGREENRPLRRSHFCQACSRHLRTITITITREKNRPPRRSHFCHTHSAPDLPLQIFNWIRFEKRFEKN